MQGFITSPENAAREITRLQQKLRWMKGVAEQQNAANVQLMIFNAKSQESNDLVIDELRAQLADLRDENEYLRGKLTELCYQGKPDTKVTCGGGI